MTATQQTTEQTAASVTVEHDVDIDELEALLAGGASDEIIVEEDAPADADELNALESALEVEEAKAAIYAEQDSAPIASLEEPAPTTPAEKKARVKKAAGATTPRVKVDADVMLSSVEVEDGVIGASPITAIKVREKATNLIKVIGGSGKLSNYTEIALRKLFADGSTTCKALTELLATSYDIGTARAQASQMVMLLPALKIAHGNAKGLTVNENSKLVPALKTVLGLAA